MNGLTNQSKNSNSSWNKNLWPPFTQIALSEAPQRVVAGDGALLFRDQGGPLIDAISSWWVTLHGHSNSYIAEEIAKQSQKIEQVIFADFVHPQAEKLAKRLSKLTGVQRLFFSDNGSTAVEVALKIACQYWQNKGEERTQIVAFDGAYHGDTFGAMALGERNLFNAPFEDMLFPVQRVPWPAYWWGNDMIEKTEKEALNKLAQHLESPTAAVIIEPFIQGAGGMQTVRKEFLRAVEELVKQSGSLLIVDEVLTGFGRCGELFAFQKAGISPDLIALSKGLTGGFLPMGVTMAKEKIFQAFVGHDPKLTLWHGHSFTANPLGCAAANASLDLLEKSPERYEDLESMHKPHLIELTKNKHVIKPRLIGTIAAFEVAVKGQTGYLNSAGAIIKKKAIEQGVFIRPLGNIVYLLPPICISTEQLHKCYSAIEVALNSL